MDDCSDSKGEEDEDEVDPEVFGESDFESDCEWGNEDAEDDHDDFVFLKVGHGVGLLGLGYLGYCSDF